MHLKDPLALDVKALLLLSLFFFFYLELLCFVIVFNIDKVQLFDNILWHKMAFMCRCAFKHSFIHYIMVKQHISLLSQSDADKETSFNIYLD